MAADRSGRKRSRRKPGRKWIKLNRRNHLKMMAVFFCIVLALAVLMGRLVYIQHTSGQKYQKIVLAQSNYDSQVIPFRRGDILDRNGIALATSLDVYNIILDSVVISSKEYYLEPTMQALMTCFPDLLSETEIRTFIKENPNSRYKVLAKQVPYEQILPFLALQQGEEPDEKDSDKSDQKEENKDSDEKDSDQKDSDKKDSKKDQENEDKEENEENKGRNIKGIWFEKEYQRNYPYKTLASSVIGSTTSGNLGMAGLENYYNDTLNGTNGRRYGYLNSDNAMEKTIKDAVDGNNIVTTIDMNIQTVVEAKIMEFNKAYRNEAREGDGAENIGVIIQDPNTGRILSMADYPNYDLSNPRSLEGFYTKEEIDQMTEDDKADALNQIWRNFCISDTFEPGSVQKPFTVAAGLDSGKLSGRESFECDGYEQIADRKIQCVARFGHGTETVQEALMDSCNDALMQMVRRIGKETFGSYQSIFGMGFKTNIDLPGEARTDTLVRTAEQMSSVDLASSSFGQSFNCTMIQVISAFSSLINGGNYYRPQVVSKITDENGNLVEEKKPELLKQTVSKETSDKIKEYLLATVSDGTANVAKVPGYSMGGKTGTAEKLPREANNYVVSFIGYLPQENPQLVIYAVIDTPNQPTEHEEQAHSTFAQNLAREILEEVLPYMNIYKDEKVKKDALKKKETNMYTEIAGYEAEAALGEAVKYH
ncbi:MAG: penicillin-binding protein 2 [Eubacterium sp.]|nr:penicillin-binding protein 2 [Eubacterium sp.]